MWSRLTRSLPRGLGGWSLGTVPKRSSAYRFMMLTISDEFTSFERYSMFPLVLLVNVIVNRDIVIIDGKINHAGIVMFFAPPSKNADFVFCNSKRLMPISRSQRNAFMIRSLSYKTLREHALYRSPDVHPSASILLHLGFADVADCIDSLLAKYVLFGEPRAV